MYAYTVGNIHPTIFLKNLTEKEKLIAVISHTVYFWLGIGYLSASTKISLPVIIDLVTYWPFFIPMELVADKVLYRNILLVGDGQF
jgi:hypothetical protein